MKSVPQKPEYPSSTSYTHIHPFRLSVPLSHPDTELGPVSSDNGSSRNLVNYSRHSSPDQLVQPLMSQEAWEFQ